MLEHEGIADRIYEAAVLPDLWTDVLARIAALSDAREAILFSERAGEVRYVTSSPAFRRDADVFFAAFGHNERTRRLIAARPSGFICDMDAFSAEERESHPIFRDFFNPRGYGNGMATLIPMPSGETIVFHVEGRYDPRAARPDAALRRLDALRAHLARSALISARLSFARAQSAVETLAGLGLAACAVDRSGTVIVGNDLFERERGVWTTRLRDRLALLDPRADRLLAEALDRIGLDEGVRSLPIRGSHARGPAVLHVVPVRRGARDLFGRAMAILVLATASGAPTGATPLLQALFDLTPMEADLAARIAGGQSVEDVATGRDRSAETVRNQLKSVLAKTGCRRQADLARVLAQLMPQSRANP